jgi:hypothetical protein
MTKEVFKKLEATFGNYCVSFQKLLTEIDSKAQQMRWISINRVFLFVYLG